jgi:dipeptidyl-peptidase-3
MASTGVAPPDMNVHLIPTETPIVVLDASQAFSGLTPKEQAYAEGLSTADWGGAKICLLQLSPEAPTIFALLQLAFGAQPASELFAAAKEKGLSDEECKQAGIYCAAFYGNFGNYKSFGDTKFVPALPAEKMQAFLTAGKADAKALEALWAECGDAMYSLRPRQRQLGLGSAKGLSTYFSSDCEESDADLSARFLESLNLSPYNTRLFKMDGRYIVLLASAVEGPGDDEVGKLCKEHTFEGQKFEVRRGDYAPLMKRVLEGLERAKASAANEHQEGMMVRYMESFNLGSINAHKEASRHWIRDVGPAVESYIGFIESYRDPSGLRGEWEGFVACVNREVSKKFQVLVDNAELLLTKMPWPREFEKDKFIRPDFTSLDVLAFGCCGVPAGINIPNYDDIRELEGFKNVSLGNVLAAGYQASGEKPVTFLQAGDQQLYKDLMGPAFEVQVGIHELLGHGSGKTFMEEEKSTLASVVNPLTGQPVSGPYYSGGATWDTKFGKVASPYEECRAECSGIYLCLENDALAAFGLPGSTDGSVTDIQYINLLMMARAGLTGLEFFTPETKAWRQAHMNARYVIMQVLLEAGQGLLELRSVTGADGKPDLEIALDRSKVNTVGKTAIGDFLVKLQVHKSLGDVAAGTELFAKYSEVPDEMLAHRSVIMARKEPRKLMVQPVMRRTDDGKVELKTFDPSIEGMIESFRARYPAQDEELLALCRAEKAFHTYE